MKVIPYSLQAAFVQDKLHSQKLRYRFLAQIIHGRPQPTGGDDNIRTVRRDAQCLQDPVPVVPDRGMPKNINAQEGQLPGQILGVRIGDLSQKQFAADSYYFCVHK